METAAEVNCTGDPTKGLLCRNLGIVVIGRNEGERLLRCLRSIKPYSQTSVYVDSGSTDGSVATAREAGIDVVELDMRIPFCAARARNAGFERLLHLDAAIRYVQFIDGDCELARDWPAAAVEALSQNDRLAVVTGWVHERCPDLSIYNRLGDLEWNSGNAGEVDAVGGIFMIRCEAFKAVGGFDSSIAAGEEPELCQRLRRQDWRVIRLDRNIATHDLAMTRFKQWWKRQLRTGYGSLDVANRFQLPVFKRIIFRARIWSAWLLVVIAVTVVAAAKMAMEAAVVAVILALAIWPAQLCRILARTWRSGEPFNVAAAHAFFTMLSFWPQMAGQLLYWKDRASARTCRVIEHKDDLVRR